MRPVVKLLRPLVNIAAGAANVDIDVAVMEQSIGQDEQANKFSAELRIRKTQVFVTSHLWHVFLFVNYLEGFLTSCSSLLIIIVISSLLTRLQT